MHIIAIIAMIAMIAVTIVVAIIAIRVPQSRSGHLRLRPPGLRSGLERRNWPWLSGGPYSQLRCSRFAEV